MGFFDIVLINQTLNAFVKDVTKYQKTQMTI